MKRYTPSKAVREAERELPEILGAINAQKQKLRAVARRLRKAASSAEQAWTIGEDRYTVEDWLATSIEAAARGELDYCDLWTSGAAAYKNLEGYLARERRLERESRAKAVLNRAIDRLRQVAPSSADAELAAALLDARSVLEQLPADLPQAPKLLTELDKAQRTLDQVTNWRDRLTTSPPAQAIRLRRPPRR